MTTPPTPHSTAETVVAVAAAGVTAVAVGLLAVGHLARRAYGHGDSELIEATWEEPGEPAEPLHMAPLSVALAMTWQESVHA